MFIHFSWGDICDIKCVRNAIESANWYTLRAFFIQSSPFLRFVKISLRYPPFTKNPGVTAGFRKAAGIFQPPYLLPATTVTTRSLAKNLKMGASRDLEREKGMDWVEMESSVASCLDEGSQTW